MTLMILYITSDKNKCNKLAVYYSVKESTGIHLESTGIHLESTGIHLESTGIHWNPPGISGGVQSIDPMVCIHAPHSPSQMSDLACSLSIYTVPESFITPTMS